MASTLLGCGLEDCGTGASEDGPGTSLLLLTLDTTRRDRLGVYGSKARLTPHLDALADEGVAFMDARTEVPITLPSHATILTGQGIREHGVRENGTFVVGEEAETLAEVLKVEGYRTAAFVSSFVLDRRFGLAQGFDHYDDEMTGVPKGEWQGHQVGRFERQGHETAARATEWLAEAEGDDAPFFLWVHFYDPHAHYRPPPQYRARGRHPYDGEVAFMDAQVGAVLEAARARTDDLVVAVASDHGEALGEHDITGHGHDVYEPAMRAVLLFQHPERAKDGLKPETRVRLTDVAATSLDLLGVDGELPGRSLRPLWEDGNDALADADPIYMETMVPALRRGGSSVHGILTGHHKLVTWPDEERRELYDLRADPSETQDLAEREPERAERLERRLRALIPKADAEALGNRVEMDEGTAAKLRALGYVE